MTRRRCTRCSPTSGFLPEPERVDPEHLLAFVTEAIWWYTTADETVQLTPEIATQVMIESSDPRSSYFREMRHQAMRPEHLFGRRMEMLTLAVLSQLRARANWHRIAREWIYGDAPVTELGREEADFYGRAAPGRGLPVLASGASAEPLRGLDLHQARGAGAPGGQPGGDPDALAAAAPAELHHPARGVGDQRLGGLVAAHRGRLHAPHQPAAADRLAAGREGVDRHRRAVRGDEPAERPDSVGTTSASRRSSRAASQRLWAIV